MPTLVLPIPETYESITRPVALEIAKKMMRFSGFPQDATFLFGGKPETVPVPGSTIGSDVNFLPKLPGSNKVTVEIDEITPIDALVVTPVMRREIPVVFKDTELGVYIKPVYQRTDIRIRISMKFRDTTSAERWRNHITTLFARGFNGDRMDVSYHYPIPLEFLPILAHIHDLRENVEPLNETAPDWLTRCLSKRHDKITDMVGKNVVLVMRENQVRINGYYDSGVPAEKPEYDQASGTATLALDYKVSYDKPISCHMDYPLVVHNQMLSRKYRSEDKVNDWQERYGEAGVSVMEMNDLTDPYPSASGGITGVSYPHYDDWLPSRQPPKTQAVVRTLLAVNPLDKRELIDLTDLGGYELDPQLIVFLKANPEMLMDTGRSPFVVTLYEGREPVDPELMVIDADLKVRSTIDLSLRKNYHLIFGMRYDLRTIKPEYLLEMSYNGPLTLKIIGALAPELVRDNKLPTLTSAGRILREEMDMVFKYISDRYLDGSQRAGFDNLHYVGGYTIVAQRRD